MMIHKHKNQAKVFDFELFELVESVTNLRTFSGKRRAKRKDKGRKQYAPFA
jgi:hypothetical protein